jgi:formylglycine-generating enzyme required for sulfatase activity
MGKSRWQSALLLAVCSVIQNGSNAFALERSAEHVLPPPRCNSRAVIWRTQEPPANPKPGDVWVNPRYGGEMVYVPAGSFLRGSAAEEGKPDEYPQRRIYLDAFWIDRYEITAGQYWMFCQATRRRMLPQMVLMQNNHPVVRVNWNDAFAYARWAGKRLPTEAEWEKAARGTNGRCFPWGDTWDSDRCANRVLTTSSGIPLSGTQPIASYPSDISPYGVMDMAGNAAEWCADYYSPNYYVDAPERNPQGPPAGNLRVTRGGAWSFIDVRFFRCANRNPFPPRREDIGLGFRCVLDAHPRRLEEAPY